MGQERKKLVNSMLSGVSLVDMSTLFYDRRKLCTRARNLAGIVRDRLVHHFHYQSGIKFR